jgi:hypothetical protein
MRRLSGGHSYLSGSRRDRGVTGRDRRHDRHHNSPTDLRLEDMRLMRSDERVRARNGDKEPRGNLLSAVGAQADWLSVHMRIIHRAFRQHAGSSYQFLSFA